MIIKYNFIKYINFQNLFCKSISRFSFACSGSNKFNHSSCSVLPLKTLTEYCDKSAVIDSNGSFTFGDIYFKSLQLREYIRKYADGGHSRTIALLLPNEASYIVSLWASWSAGFIAVPLYPVHPDPQLKYYMEDSKADVIITDESSARRCEVAFPDKHLVIYENVLRNSDRLPSGSEIEKSLKDDESRTASAGNSSSNALIIYTSGSTGPPKGVVLSHSNIQSQIQSLISSWKIQSSDVLLHCLPLNHIHGIVNALLCPLSCGARVIMEPSFNASSVWSKLLNLDSDISQRVSLFMAVPSIYVKLIEEHENKISKHLRRSEFVKKVCKENIRLMISGSAPLPTTVFEKWNQITGHILLERYGMTEIGMALSNPLEKERKPGFVGQPFPGVRVKIVKFSPRRDSYQTICEGDHLSTSVEQGMEEEAGELLIKGPSVFQMYWEREEATKKEFTDDGWFCTGDTAAFIGGYYKILGRTSVDIIKTGGFKVSALGVERVLLEHPQVLDVAVFGIPDLTWGEKVAAVIEWDSESKFDLKEFRRWAKERIPHYQVPSAVKITEGKITRNAMGKINKKELKKLFQ